MSRSTCASSTRGKANDRIFTWRDLPYPANDGRQMEIAWWWSGWDHAARDRQHLLEAKRLWETKFKPEVMKPFFNALRSDHLGQCRPAFHRMAETWRGPFQVVFGLPRVIQCRAYQQRGGKSRSVLLFATEHGLIFVARSGGADCKLWTLATFYFPRALVNGLASFPDFFESSAAGDLASAYVRTSKEKLPDPANGNHFVKRRHETDREIRFFSPARWGFASDVPGARWNGVPQRSEEPCPAEREDAPLDPPPAKRMPPGEGDES